ncbi:hypothetical protein ACGFXC_09120 [Streptomyces sp. NPDC048507]|uniref:hypothetical protein n=1 Tax=Streptomyces sp. NPDC048507 TaxID=3365560 RepID=UPI00371F3649
MTTTATDRRLYDISRLWPDLTDALTEHTNSWPPAGKGDLLRALDQRDADEVAYARAHAAHRRSRERDPGQIGEVSAPLNVGILDTIRAVEAALLHLADTLAADIQQSAHNDEDAANPARWRWTGTRTAPEAALWLLARWDDHPGRLRDRPDIPSPFRALSDAHRARITAVADGACARIEQALDLVGRDRILAEPCACGGRITLRGGGGADPVARCGQCGRVWTLAGSAAA